MPQSCKIKICGLTSLADAEAAVAAGADFLGFIFAPESSRRTTPEQVRDIVAALSRTVKTVGVFVNENPDTVKSIVELCGLDIVQLHGEEPKEWINILRKTVEVWKTVWPTSRADIAKIIKIPADAVVVDTMLAGQRGGTGRTGDWRLAGQLADRCKIVLAGGLNPENTAAAIQTVHPFAVDVAGGVETAPGTKNPAKIRSFCTAVRGVVGY